jgi:hypothetical protein
LTDGSNIPPVLVEIARKASRQYAVQHFHDKSRAVPGYNSNRSNLTDRAAAAVKERLQWSLSREPVGKARNKPEPGNAPHSAAAGIGTVASQSLQLPVRHV